jgi:hypothetical protein
MMTHAIPRSNAALKALLCLQFGSASLCRTAAYAVVATFFIGQSLFSVALLSAQSPQAPAQAPAQPSAQTSKPSHKKASSHANLAAAQPPPQPAPPAPVAPPPPDWPANDRPSDATVTWDAHGLSIVAANSSLSQILKQVCTQTGATMEGLNRDQRIFGVYGPGPAREVIAQLLDGSDYNVLMIGDLGQGTPRQIVLSGRTGGAAQPAITNQQNTDTDNDAEPEEQAQQPEPPPPPQQPAPTQTGTAPAVPVRSQQQIIQELQERQQQAQQQQPNPQ